MTNSNKPEVLAIIPARGGSKGLPRKNVLPLLGHPLIAYSIKAALESSVVTRTIVSTDDSEIADVSKKYGAELPFIRPAEFAQDLSTDLEVFKHAIQWLKENENYVPDYIVQLRPTSPVRPKGIIDTCFNKMKDNQGDSLRILTDSPLTPYKMWQLNEDGTEMKPLLYLEDNKEPYNSPRQILPKTYWQIGTLDIIKTSCITELNSMSGKTIIPYYITPDYAIDIDDIGSFEKAAQAIETNECIRFS
ncbi:acylneuraminate cytidylyltransferase family protein [Polluticaenibacter yanchengensis]|uniref:Acylneuraminate cytidylyltransferase family protein n=1 Tax=Polluticaenibacter yanchengensis TaxID=3014562 RepID=A0ABT4UMH6_9BACT|nr:acylneuraminate cytidylyltransferase family protein [Chitinophagaceae bacterium LY-5]